MVKNGGWGFEVGGNVHYVASFTKRHNWSGLVQISLLVKTVRPDSSIQGGGITLLHLPEKKGQIV